MDRILSVLPISPEDRAELRAATRPDWVDALGHFDCLRFEQVMEALEWSLDDLGDLVRIVFPPTVPNRYHHQIVHLLETGHPVLTTNFDDLIEQACAVRGVPCSPVVLERDYDRYLQDPAAFPNPIFKLHGSLATEASTEVMPTVVTTFASTVTGRSQNVRKWRVVDDLLASNALLVVGYSGFDDFDVLPAIRFAAGKQKLMWVEHAPSGPVQFHSASEFVREGADVNPRLRWFIGRMFGSHLYLGRVKRRPEDVAVIHGPTERVLDALVFDPELPVAPASLEEAGDTGPDELQRAFRGLLAEPTPQVMLFAGRLLRSVGRYDRAVVCLEQALDRVDPSADPRLCGRLHAAFARILLDREQWYAAHGHLAAARELFLQVAELHDRDVEEFLEFSVRLGIDAIDLQDPAFLRRKTAADIAAIQTRLDRKVAWRECLLRARRSDHAGAFEALIQGLGGDFDSLGLEEQMDYRFLLLRIDRDRHLTMARLEMREDGAWDENDKNKYGLVLQDIRETYEFLQVKPKWAQAFIFSAEEHLWSCSPDWAYEEAQAARLIYARIGHALGVARLRSPARAPGANWPRGNRSGPLPPGR